MLSILMEVMKMKLNKIQTCNKNEGIVEVAKILRDSNERHIYITDEEGKVLGIISTVDISSKVVAEGKDARHVKVWQIMNSPVDFVDINQEPEFALKIMMERNTLACPVVENGILLGTVAYNEVFSKVSQKIKGGN